MGVGQKKMMKKLWGKSWMVKIKPSNALCIQEMIEEYATNDAISWSLRYLTLDFTARGKGEIRTFAFISEDLIYKRQGKFDRPTQGSIKLPLT